MENLGRTLFNNREIATAIWLALIAPFFLRQQSVRAGVKNLVLISVHPQILVALSLMLAYTILEVALLASIRAWQVGLLKDTILWFCFTGLALLMNAVTSSHKENTFLEVLRANVKVIILITFLLNTYTLPLLGELVLVPCITLFTLLATFADAKKEYHQVAKFMNGILAVAGFGLLAWAVSNAVSDWHGLAKFATLQKLALPPLLSILFTPFLFAAVLFSAYETLFTKLRIGREKNPKVIRYAKWRILRVFGLRLSKLQEFSTQNAWALTRIETRQDVDQLLAKTL